MAAEDEETKKKLADTNMENYGGEEHRNKQRAIAEKQPEWFGAGEKEGTRVWRIEQFQVKDWPREEYGSFFGGDSYIVLHTYKEDGGEEILHNVHFWLGEDTSQDEAGAAAIKTVELDDKLGDLPVQYRQVQGHETKEFTSLFPNMNIMEGGTESGFNHVEPTEYEHRLFHVSGRGKKVRAKQIPLNLENLNNNDTFLLDAGTVLYNFYPDGASVWEKRGCLEKANKIEAKRSGKVSDKFIIEGCDGTCSSKEEEEFWKHFGGKPESLPAKSAYQAKKAAEEEAYATHVNKMFHITNEGGGAVTTEEVCSGVLDKSILAKEDDDVLVIDVGRIIYVWIGTSANREEIGHAMENAQNYLYSSGRPAHTPISRIFSGREPSDFWKCFGCEHVASSICN